MAQANQEARTEAADEASDKNSRRVSWAVRVAVQCRNTAQDQHSKASGSCSVFATRSSLVQHVLHLRSNHQYAPLSGSHFELWRNTKLHLEKMA